MKRYWEFGVDFFLFAVTVAMAAWFQWSAGDLIWSLWIASLTLGYIFLLVGIAGLFFHAPPGTDEDEEEIKLPRTPTDYLKAAIVASFLLAFFSFHYLMFHFGHAAFLSEFFPLEGSRHSDPFSGMGPFNFGLAAEVAAMYWPFIAVSIPSRLGDYKRSFLKPGGPAVMFKPYINVVRMHILIFVFAGLAALNLQSLAIYPVLIFYFFPYRRAYEFWQSKKRA